MVEISTREKQATLMPAALGPISVVVAFGITRPSGPTFWKFSLLK